MVATSSPASAANPDKDQLVRIGRKVRTRLAANKAVKRIGVDNAELWMVRNVFDTVECGRLMAIIDTVARPSTAFHMDYSTGFRTSYSGDMDPLDPFIRTLQQRIDTLLGFDPAHSETMQGQRYLPGQHFRPHVDWFDPRSSIYASEKANGGQRAFTAMAYLNDVEAGGETEFPQLGIAVRPRAGMLLIWNNADEGGAPNPWTVHSGNPVARGSKYVVTKWYRCGRWR